MYKTSLFFMSPEVRPFLMLLAIVDLILKGVTLYKSAKRDQTIWFVALLLVNSLGILPAIYLILHKDIAFSKPVKATTKKVSKHAKK